RIFVVPLAPSRANEQNDHFQEACFMWWDIFPTHGGPIYGNNTGGEPELHVACLNTMAEILSIRSELCQLSALHGLNHWHSSYGEKVEERGHLPRENSRLDDSHNRVRRQSAGWRGI